MQNLNMLKLIVMIYNGVWRAEEVRLTEVKKGNYIFEGALAVQRKLDGALTFNSIDVLNAEGIATKTFLKTICGRMFQSTPLSYERQYSSAFKETLSGVGIDQSFVQQISEQLLPGFSTLMILLEEHLAESIHLLATQTGGTFIQNDVWNDDHENFTRTVEKKIVDIVAKKN